MYWASIRKPECDSGGLGPFYACINATLGPFIFLNYFEWEKIERERERERVRERPAIGEKGRKEEKKKEKKRGENMDGGGDKGGEKKVGGPITVVLQLDMHCEGCARKTKESVKNFEGVESVSTKLANNELTVIGRVDPGKIRDRVESKTRRKVDLISPANAPQKDSAPKDSSEPKKAQPDSKDQKKPDHKMPKPHAVSTMVSNIRLQGGDDGDEKKEKSGEKGRDGGGDGEGKEGGGEKKEGGKKDEGGQKQAAAAAVAPVAVEANEMEYYVPYDAYRAEMLQAPQLFSDENPNACSIM